MKILLPAAYLKWRYANAGHLYSRDVLIVSKKGSKNRNYLNFYFKSPIPIADFLENHGKNHEKA